MDTLELFRSCKNGDLEKIRMLVEFRDVDVNVRDKWDSSPLYYACLCGHQEIVEYLIGVGARCEANTFDGERCLYGALTDDIRRILTHHNLVSAHTMRRDAYDEFLRILYETGEESDVKFIVNGKELNLHKCLLAARSQYFCDMFTSKWANRDVVTINSNFVDSCAFDAVMRYIYTGRLECPVDMIDHCLRVAHNCKLAQFKAKVEDAQKAALALQVGKSGCVKITTMVVESDYNNPSEEVASDLRELVQKSLPSHLRVWPTDMPFSSAALQPTFPDVCFIVEEQEFMCHKMFFRPRSEYFRALLDDHFQEVTIDSVPKITLHEVSISVFSIIVHYLYTNKVHVTEENAMEVLHVSDMYLMKGLVRQVAVFLGRNLDDENILEVHAISRLFQLPRLEDQCVAFMAQNLESVMEQDSFMEIVRNDAHEVHDRHETDTITIIDELRYHITSSLTTFSDIESVRAKLDALEDILEQLELQG